MALPFYDAHVQLTRPAPVGPGRAGSCSRAGEPGAPEPGAPVTDAPVTEAAVAEAVAEYRASVVGLLGPAGFVPRGGAVLLEPTDTVDPGPVREVLQELGVDYVGIAELPAQVTDAQIQRLDVVGVRALRVDLSTSWDPSDLDDLVDLALRARVVAGWHLELRADPSALAELAELLPDPDGLVVEPVGGRVSGLAALLALVEEGARVKILGFDRGVDGAELAAVLGDLNRANPEALVAGTGLLVASPALQAADLDLLGGAFEDLEDLRAATYRNARQLYGQGRR